MKLIIAGGGTGGHLFPGIAIAESLQLLDVDSEVLFVGTERGIEAREVPKAGFEVRFIKVGGLKGMGIAKRLKTLLAIPASLLESRKIIKDFGADAVIGVGGYASGPLVMAAALSGVPTAICEQNSVPGMTNKILSKMVRKIFGSFASSRSYFPAKKFELVGNPVRHGFLEAAQKEKGQGDKELVFVFGGSQGARPLNEKLPALLGGLVKSGVSLHVIHQAGKNDVEAVTQRYRDAGVEAEVTPFIDDMVSVYRKARLVICRAGATSCAEVAALGVVSVLIPFPEAADDHQTLNAKDLADEGAAMLLKQSAIESEGPDMIRQLLSDDELWKDMAEKSKKMGRLDAGKHIAQAATQGFKGAPS